MQRDIESYLPTERLPMEQMPLFQNTRPREESAAPSDSDGEFFYEYGEGPQAGAHPELPIPSLEASFGTAVCDIMTAAKCSGHIAAAAYDYYVALGCFSFLAYSAKA